MFASALKSFSSNINSNYTLESAPSSVSGPWKIFDARKKSTGKAASVFVFDRKSLESNGGGLGGRASSSSLKIAHQEVLERLKKETSSLARLRHPSILELVEPVEETRSGLQFATESVTASLAGLLLEKDEEERANGGGGRSSRYMQKDSNGERTEIEIDELEIQKGLLQVSKALEFLHENAGLVHGNLTPEAVFINAKGDWKLSGFSFTSPPANSTKASSIAPISLAEVLNIDARLPRSVQIALDYTSPDFVLDSNLNTSADMFSLGLLIIALYNSPHTSPLETHGSITTYKRLFTSSSTVPSVNNNFSSSRPLPEDLRDKVLPRLITRRPAQRMTATEFQQSAYFDNTLVSTIRFLDGIAAKTPNEKSSFMRGLVRVLPKFPKSVLEKKLLPALLEEMKDPTLLSLILSNIFSIVKALPSGKRSFTEKVLPRFREIFLVGQRMTSERDTQKEAGLMVVLKEISTIAENCSGKEFKDEILPLVTLAIESPTHSMVDSALRALPIVLPILDFSTIKNELFPVIATVFSKTSSLGIKVRGLEAFVILCGGSLEAQPSDDGLSGITASTTKKSSGSNVLDKYTMQEKVVPLIRAIKTKEPAVMIASLNVLRQVGGIADKEFIASDILPLLWTHALGPLLNLDQFQSFMELIKSLSARVEQEHTKALQELTGSNNGSKPNGNEDFMSFEGATGFPTNNGAGESADDFERLVKGNGSSNSAVVIDSGWGDAMVKPQGANMLSQPSAKFAWSTPSPTTPVPPNNMAGGMRPPTAPTSRTITPDLSRFDALTPMTTQFLQPLQPTSGYNNTTASIQTQTQQTSLNWGATSHNPWSTSSTSTQSSASSNPNPWGSTAAPSLPSLVAMNNPMGYMSMSSNNNSMSNTSTNPRPLTAKNNFSSFSLPPPPATGQNISLAPQQHRGFPPPAAGGFKNGFNHNIQVNSNTPKSGLDKFESLL